MSAMLGRGRGELQATRTGKSTPALVALRVVALERDAASVYRSIRSPAMDARGAWPAVRYALLSSLSPSHVVELKGAERWEGAADAGAAWDDATGAVCSSGLRAFNTATCVHGVSTPEGPKLTGTPLVPLRCITCTGIIQNSGGGGWRTLCPSNRGACEALQAELSTYSISSAE